MGLLLGIELVKDRHKREAFAEFGKGVTRRCLDLGLSINIISLPGMACVWRLAPPLSVTIEEINLALTNLEQAIEDQFAGTKLKALRGRVGINDEGPDRPPLVRISRG